MPICPVCQSQSSNEAWQYRSYSIYECSGCDLQHAYPMQAASAEYYQTQYNNLLASFLSGNIHPGYRFLVKKIRDATRRYLSPDQRRVIDVGCGPGYLLLDLQENGFECLGIDFNPAAIRVAREHFHVPAEIASLEEIATWKLRFDLALLSHVLEHVEDPLGLLKKIRQILYPRGVLVIELPNRNRSRHRDSLRKGKLSWGEYPPHHLTFWSVAAISNVLVRAGYSILECRPRPYPEAYQTEHSLIHRFNLRAGRGTTWLARILQLVGRLAGLQGATLNVVARRLE